MKVFFWVIYLQKQVLLPTCRLNCGSCNPTSPTVPIPKNSDDDLHMLLQQNGDHTDIRWSAANFIIFSPSFSINPTNCMYKSPCSSDLSVFLRKSQVFPIRPQQSPAPWSNRSDKWKLISLHFAGVSPARTWNSHRTHHGKSDGNNFSTALCLAPGQHLHSELENGWTFGP